MRKLLIALLVLPALSFASSLDMSTLACKDLKLDSATTLKDVQDNCLIKKATPSNGRYEVKFVNTTTNDTVTCYFAENNPASKLNSCH
jgi:hypothetical protein